MFVIPIILAVGVTNGLSELGEFSFATTAKVGAINYLVWLGLNAVPLQLRAQSIGKMMLGIVIVDELDRPAPLLRIAVDRTLSVQALALLPYVGGAIALVDVLFIFAADRRCLHDHIARTHVVDRASLLAAQADAQRSGPVSPIGPAPYAP
jgi:uncharacterized RDD family membrane protein YckC